MEQALCMCMSYNFLDFGIFIDIKQFYVNHRKFHDIQFFGYSPIFVIKYDYSTRNVVFL